MAYLKNPLEDDQQQQQGQPATPSTSGIIDGQTQAGSNTGTPGASANGADQRTPGTGFVNLQSYINANGGEGARMVNQTNQGLINDVDGYGKDAAKTTADQSESLAKQAGTNNGINKLKSGIVSSPVTTQSAARDFLGQRVDTTAADNATAALGARKADINDQLGHAGDPGMQVTKLQDTYGKGPSPYSQGFSTLDQFLVQGSKDGQDATAALRGRTADVDKAYGAAQSGVATAADAARQKLAANQTDIRNAAHGQIGAIERSGKVQAAKLNRSLDTQNYDGTQTASLGNGLTDAQRADLAALASLSGDRVNGWWNKKTFDPGTAKPVTPAPEAEPAAAPDPDHSGITNPGNPSNPTNSKPIYTGGPDNIPQPDVVLPDPGNLIPDDTAQQAADAADKLPGVPKLRKWCLVSGTPIAMANGTFKPVDQLEVGDEVAEGGRVTEVLPAQLSGSVFRYGAVLVAEGHAVLADGRWTRIGQVGTRIMGSFPVYPVNTERHLLIADGITFADHQEVSGIDDDDACLAALNAAIRTEISA